MAMVIWGGAPSLPGRVTARQGGCPVDQAKGPAEGFCGGSQGVCTNANSDWFCQKGTPVQKFFSRPRVGRSSLGVVSRGSRPAPTGEAFRSTNGRTNNDMPRLRPGGRRSRRRGRCPRSGRGGGVRPRVGGGGSGFRGFRPRPAGWGREAFRSTSGVRRPFLACDVQSL